MKYLIIFFLFIFSFSFSQKKVKIDTILMGSQFSFVVYDDNEELAKSAINEGIKEISRIENEISDWISTTPISKINANAGIQPVKVNDEVFSLFKRALNYSKISEGRFDITYAGMDKIWKFDGSMRNLPTQNEIKIALKTVGYQNIILNEKDKSIFLKLSKSKISFGSIGKAYASQKAAEKIKSLGIENILIDASGDLYVFGNPSRKKCWKIGIQNPFKQNKINTKICARNEAVLTSGDYEKYIFINGKRYGHIINPKTGMPSSENVSVTIKGKDAEMANFLSTTLMISNEKETLKLAKLYKNYKIWIIQSNGKLKIYN